MALTSTLYTGLSGLSANQTKLNIIGNNIANVNTTAFKSSRALFRPQLYVTDAAGAAPDGEFGGTNPSQRGLGVQVGTIQRNFNQGNLETTGVKTDLAIEGEGFFIVNGGGADSYTRDGTFTTNEDSQLVTSRGEYVRGYAIDEDFNIIDTQVTNLEIPLRKLTIAKPTESIGMIGNFNTSGVPATAASVLNSDVPLLDAAGAAPTGATLLADLRAANDLAAPLFTDGQVIDLNARRNGAEIDPEGNMTLEVDGAATTLDDLLAYMEVALGINTNADVAAAAPAGFAPGVALAAATAAGDPVGSLRLNVTSNVGVSNSTSILGGLPFGMTETTAAEGESTRTSLNAYDTLGNVIGVEVNAVFEQALPDGGTVWRFWTRSNDTADAAAYTPGTTGGILGSGTITFDAEGNFVSQANNAVTVDRTGTGADPELTFDLNFSRMTALSGQSSLLNPDPINPVAGFATQTLVDFTISDTGLIEGIFSGNARRPLGQIALAQFDNPEALLDQGGNNFTVGPGSGDPIVAKPTQAGLGRLLAGRLEGSNVDISREFIDMIVTSTGFSAASRVISTGDRLMTELLNLQR